MAGGKKDKIKDKDRFSILVPSLDRCFLCGSQENVALHEVFYGTANRKKSKEDGCVVPLCEFHHNGSNVGVHFNHELDLKLKQQAEKLWIAKYCNEESTEEEKIKKFIDRFGKNYLDEDD